MRSLSLETDDTTLTIRAELALGHAFEATGHPTEAERYFSSAYDRSLAWRTVEPTTTADDLLLQSTVWCAVTRAHRVMKKFLTLFHSNNDGLKELLKWKSSAELPDL